MVKVIYAIFYQKLVQYPLCINLYTYIYAIIEIVIES